MAMAANHGFDRSKERLLLSRKGCSAFFEEPDNNGGTDASILDRIAKKWEDFQVFMVQIYEMGRSDPRQIIFAAKSGLALALVSTLIFFKESLRYFRATLSKGFNRAIGTVSAAILALCVAQASVWAGAWHEVVVVVSIFAAGTITSFVKLYPSMKAYEYGFRVFMLTFSIVLVSGTSHFYRTAISRLLLVAVGASVCLIVNICIYPIWSGEDLHKLVVKNFRGVASSLEGCVRSYLENVEYERIPSKILLGFAIWEPPHGRYRMFRYPWVQFIKVSGALRHCAFMVLREIGNKLEKLERLSPDFDLLDKVHEAAEDLQMLIDQKSYHLVNSEKWAAARRPKEFEDPEHLQELKEEETHMYTMGSSTSTLKPSHTFKNIDRHITNMSMNPSFANWGSSEDVLRQQVQWPSRLSVLGDVILNDREVRTYESASALSLTNFTSSLIEFVARLQNILNSYEELSEKARFSEPKNDLEKPEDRNSCLYVNVISTILIDA
ncbi:Aluminum-activated malate transporter, partial [Cynara cardunculus var. scolymus]